MLKHSVAYDFNLHPPLIGFDIWSFKENKFVEPAYAILLFNSLGIQFVPVLNIAFTAEEASKLKIDDTLVPKSEYYAGQCEGIIFKNYKKQIFGKYVTAKFKEVNKEVWGLSKRQARAGGEDTDIFTTTYAGNARIDKAIFELVNNGEKLSMELMHKVPQKVLTDIYEENWRDILNSNMILDMRAIKKAVSKRCLEVLKRVIANNLITQ
jgi:hypothetical protein